MEFNGNLFAYTLRSTKTLLRKLINVMGSLGVGAGFSSAGGGGLFLRDTDAKDIRGWQWATSSGLLSQINVPIWVYAVGYNVPRPTRLFRLFSEKPYCTCWHGFVCWAQKQWERERRLRISPSFVAWQNAIPAMHYNFFGQAIQRLFLDIKSPPRKFRSTNCVINRTYLRYPGREKQALRETAGEVKELVQTLDCGIKHFSHYEEADNAMLGCLEEAGVNCEFVALSQKVHLKLDKHIVNH